MLLRVAGRFSRGLSGGPGRVSVAPPGTVGARS